MSRPVGPQPAIPHALWPELQRQDRERKTLPVIVEWLAREHGIRVSAATVSRTLTKIRAAAPPPAPVVLAPADPDPSARLDPATEEEELKTIRAEIRKDLRSVEWKARHSAARLLLEVLAEHRARREEAQQPAFPPAASQPEDPGGYVPSVIFSAASPKGEA